MSKKGDENRKLFCYLDSILPLPLQKPHQKRIREDEFLLAESEFDVDVFVVVVEFHHSAFAELLMGNDTANSHSFQLCH